MNFQLSRLFKWRCRGLRIGGSTTELPRPLIIKDLFPCFAAVNKFASNLRCSRSVSAIVAQALSRKSSTLLSDLCPGSERGSSQFHSRNALSPRVQYQNQTARQTKRDSKIDVSLLSTLSQALEFKGFAVPHRAWLSGASTNSTRKKDLLSTVDLRMQYNNYRNSWQDKPS